CSFFFSSRRRHTISKRDWSSDVCSSDLPQIIDDFVNYAKTLFTRFGDKVKYWITLNEQNIFTSLGWLTAQHPPGKFDDQKMFYQVNHHAFMAHAKTVLAYREMGGKGEIGASFA